MRDADTNNDALREAISEAIRAYRRSTKTTQRALAEKVGISPASLSAYETGIKMPPLEIALRLARGVELPLDALLGRGGDRASDSIVSYDDLIYYMNLLLGENARSSLFDIRVDGSSASLCTDDEDCVAILTAWQNLLKLYRSGTINAEIYGAWVAHKSAEYQGRLISGQASDDGQDDIDIDDIGMAAYGGISGLSEKDKREIADFIRSKKRAKQKGTV